MNCRQSEEVPLTVVGVTKMPETHTKTKQQRFIPVLCSTNCTLKPHSHWEQSQLTHCLLGFFELRGPLMEALCQRIDTINFENSCQCAGHIQTLVSLQVVEYQIVRSATQAKQSFVCLFSRMFVELNFALLLSFPRTPTTIV